MASPYRTPYAIDRPANIRCSEQREDVATTNFSAHHPSVTAGELRCFLHPDTISTYTRCRLQKFRSYHAQLDRASRWHVSKADSPYYIAHGQILAASCPPLTKCRRNPTDACILAPRVETEIPYFGILGGTWDASHREGRRRPARCSVYQRNIQIYISCSTQCRQ